MTHAPRFSSLRPKIHFDGRRRSKIADPINYRCRIPRSTRLISVAQAGAFALRTRRLKFYGLCNSKVLSPAHSLPRRARATQHRMSGSNRYPFGSQSPRRQSTSSSDHAETDDAPSGRERLAIRFLAGQARPRTSSIGPGSASGSSPEHVRQRVASAHIPGASSHRASAAAPSGLGPGGGASPIYAMHGSPPDTRGRTYQLEVEQHPERTAEFGPAMLSRLPLAPAPIVKLTIRDHTGSPIDPNTELPYLIAHLSLCTEAGHPLDGVPGAPSQHLLYGTLVSSAQVLRNLRGRVAPYFIFPDVSVRQRGRYSLNITLVRLPGIGGLSTTSAGNRGNALTSVYTQVFEVVSQTNYGAPAPTQLTQLFIRQGARMYAFESSLQHPPTLD
ncbi:velvet factor-domain-containing protein [Phellopilus nigrolimitatus]|nr:velvet factor-domain-containing protein [Phellopilus nigrolimitatus]